jgi:hypothetical protein
MAMAYSDALSRQQPGGTVEYRKNFNQEQQLLGRDFDLEPGKSGVLPTQPEHLLIILYKCVAQ